MTREERRKMPPDVKKNMKMRQKERGRRRGEEEKALLMNIKIYLHAAAALDESERCEPRARGESLLL